MRSWLFGVAAGIAAVAFWPALPAAGRTWLLLPTALLSLSGRTPLCRLVAGLALGAFLGIAHGRALLADRLPAACVGSTITVSGAVASLPRLDRMPDGTLRQRFELSVDAMHPASCAGASRLALSYYGEEHIIPGQRWRLAVRLKQPWGLANPGSYNAQAWFARRGVDAVGRVLGTVPPQRLGGLAPAALHHRVRQSVAQAIAALPVPSDAAAVLAALTVADKNAVDHALWRTFQRLGISHLLVISGLHIGLVAGGAYLLGVFALRALAPWTQRGSWLPGAMSLCAASVYAVLAGFSLPTQRALYMLTVFTLAALTGRRSSSAGNLLLAAVAVLTVNPLAPTGSGFWLSFGAVAALLWLARWQRDGNRLLRAIGTHAFIALAMLPMGAWFFGGGSFVAMFANLVMIPLVGVFVVPLALLGALLHVAGTDLAGNVWQLAALPLEIVLPRMQALSAGAGGWLYRPLDGGAGAVFLAGLGVCLLVLPFGIRARLAWAVLLAPLLLPSAPLPGDAVGETAMTFLDVGQGTAVVVRAGRRALLYDTGGGSPGGRSLADNVIIPYLREEGIRRLDTFVVSHGDFDHSAGASDILEAFEVGRLRFGSGDSLAGRGRRCRAGESWRWPGGQVFRFLSPARETGLKSNDSSCVLMISAGEYHILLPGDIGTARERELVQFWREELEANALLAAHHGSNTSSSHTLLKTVRPGIALLTAGYENRFGHPHPDVIARLRSHGARTLNTAEEGAVEIIVAPGGDVRVNRFRAEHSYYWM
ncbi:MAG: DNA internalization-related competence protein ComEC/Rec2 [Halioglobus sp.]|nr:DNA internalization-related competence protein ComEC/Rec2 [Halioglobus sp.]